VLRLQDYACPQKRSFSGFFSDGASTAYPGLEAVETKCMAKGDPYCEFVVTFPKKK
jgi:predicted hydrocarbon binding protein